MKKNLKILLLEDNYADAEMVMRIIKKDGILFESMIVDNRNDFINSLHEQAFDLVLSDNTLPQFDATEAIQIVRKEFPNMPFILITGTVHEDFIISIIKLGIDDYILKDRLSRLPSAIKSVLKAREDAVQKEIAQEELKKSEAKYRFLIEHVSNGVYAVDKDWQVLYMNKTAADIFNCDPEKIVGKNLWQEFPYLVGGKFYNAYHKAMETQKEVFIEDYSAHFDKWASASAFPAQEGLVIFFRDITEKKKAELAYLKSQEQYREMVERITDAFVSLDKDFNYLFLNKQAGELIHKDPEMLIGKNVWEVFPDAVGSKTYDAFEKSMKEQIYVCNIDYYAPLDLWQENHIYPSKDGLSIFIRDISEQKRSELAAKQSENVRNLIMSSALDAIICIDTSGKIIFWNNRAELLFGWSFDDMKGHSIADTIIPPQHRNSHLSGMKKYVASGEKKVAGKMIELTALNRRGEEFPIELFMIPVKTSSPEFFCAFIRDISERKNLERQLTEQQKTAAIEITSTALEAQEKERNTIGQELHDNINQILVGTKILLQLSKSIPDKSQDYLEKAIEGLNEAIKENRKLAHEMVTPDIENETISNLLIKLTEDMFSLQAGLKVEIKTDSFNEHSIQNNHKLTLYRIAQEQCTNILKYAHATQVNILLENNNNSVYMRIRDNGRGMDSDKKTDGIGLKNIKSRLSIFNGSSAIITSPGKGFALTIEIPL